MRFRVPKFGIQFGEVPFGEVLTAPIFGNQLLAGHPVSSSDGLLWQVAPGQGGGAARIPPQAIPSQAIQPQEIIRSANLSGSSACDAEGLRPQGSAPEGLALQENQRWYLVYTLPKRELQARMRLQVQGFRTYLPQYLRTTRHARQLRTQRAPLFPRYLFVILDLGRDRWLSVRGTIGVSALVGREERPMPVPQGVIEALMAQADANNLIQFGDSLQAGQKVRIASGPFADLIGRLDRLDDTGRVRLLLDMMGSEIAITLPRTGILPAA